MSDKQEFEKYPALTEIIQHFAAHVPVDLRMWSNFLEEINNALQAASQPPAVKGAMQWVSVGQRLPEIVDNKCKPRYVQVERKNYNGNTHIAKAVAYYFPRRFKSVEFEDWDDYDEKDFPYTEADDGRGVVWLKAGWYESVNCERCDEYWSAPLNVIKWLDESSESPTAAGDGEAREMIENILYATGKFFEEQCTELADIILKEIKGAGDGKEAKYDELYRLVYSNLAKLRARTQHADRMIGKHSDIRAIIEDVTKQMQAMPQPDSVVSPFQPFETNTMNFRGSSSHCKACEDEAAGIKHITAAKHTCRKQQNK